MTWFVLQREAPPCAGTWVPPEPCRRTGIPATPAISPEQVVVASEGAFKQLRIVALACDC